MFSFINVFDEKPDHAMFDAKQAKILLADLPRDDAFKALEDVTTWLTSVKGTMGFRPEVRVEVIMLLDETGLPFYEQLLQLYMGKSHLQSFKGNQLWQGMNDFKKVVADAYSVCIEECHLTEKKSAAYTKATPIISARLIRALSEQMQLSMMRYIEPEKAMWEHLCNCYVFAMANQIADTMSIIYPKQSQLASPHHEFLRALMLYIASPATLAPDQISACYRIAGLLAASFDFKDSATADCTHWISLTKPGAPKRVNDQTQATASMRFFGATKAVAKVESILELQTQAIAQKEQRGQNEFTPSGKLTLLKHLQIYWGKRQPGRIQDRQDTISTLEVVHGLQAISEKVTRIEQDSLVNLPADGVSTEKSSPHIKLSSGEAATASEIWIVFDVSENGVGGIIPKAAGAWVKIGDLCAIKLEESQLWWVGMVRRLKTSKDGDTQVGIEILSKKPLAVWLRIPNLNAGKGFEWEAGIETTMRKSKPAILLPDTNNSYANATMLIESGSYSANEEYELKMGKKSSVKLNNLLEEGEDYERVSFALSSI
jgi:hypothetical protein